MTDKASAPNWQRLQLADFGSADANVRSALPHVQNKSHAAAGKREHEQSQGFQKGYSEGLAAGRAEGLAAGEAAGAEEGQQAARQLLSLAANLDKTLAGLDQEIAEEILALALEIARQILRQTVTAKPESVLAVVREALNQLPHQHAAIYLHPDDATLVRKLAGDQFTHVGHRIHEDPRLQRSDVIIEASGAHIDATLATRWRRIVESLGSKTPWIDDEKAHERQQL